jgi:hypothetical protein
VIFVICRRLLGPIGAAALLAATLPSAVFATTYGKLIVRNNAMPASALDTQFSHVRPPRSFLLVVTEPSKTELQFRWSVHCDSASRRESGGASGEATVSSGHWVKQVRATWIKHPAYCTGSIVGSAASSPVLVRVFTQ